MIYTFECYAEDGGCGSQFEISCGMDTISTLKPKCPGCRKKKAVSRVFDAILVSVPRTLGHQVDKNTDKMSDDYKHHLTKKHNAYREKPFSGKMPDGCKVFDQNIEGKKRFSNE